MTFDKKIIITTVYDRRVIVHLYNDNVEHIRVLPDSEDYPIGTIVVGRVVKMLPSANACFVDIGSDSNYFVKLPVSNKSILFADGKTHEKIHCEDEILVQVSSEAVKSKAPSANVLISISGKAIVVETGKGLSYSKKLSEADKKKLKLPEAIIAAAKTHHIIVRTEYTQIEDKALLYEDCIKTLEKYDNVLLRSATCKAKTILYKPTLLIESSINEWIKSQEAEVITDCTEIADRLNNSYLPEHPNISVRFYSDDNLALCKLYKLETHIDELLAKRVYLKSGAFLVVEQGETLTAIDVNSAHSTQGNKEEASIKINCEAAEEIGHILKARNISGMILVDFINMKDASNTKKLIELVKSIMAKDDSNAKFIDMTGLGLVELTRRRVYKSFIEQWKK